MRSGFYGRNPTTQETAEAIKLLEQATQIATDVQADASAADTAKNEAQGHAVNAAASAAAAATSQTNVANSATAAATSAANAATQVGLAADQVALATTQANNAATSATAAATSATNASSSAASAATNATTAQNLLNDFKGRYFGGAAVDPTVDLNGAALTSGDLYFNTSTNSMRVYGSEGWKDATANVVVTQWRIDAASANLTVLSGGDDGGQTLAYTPGLESVFRNGVRLSYSTDYVRTNNGTITLNEACAAGDSITVLAMSPFAGMADVYLKSEVNTLLAGKSATTHDHDTTYVKRDGSNFGGFGLRNRIINGGGTISQRGNSLTHAGPIQYSSADRWQLWTDGTATAIASGVANHTAGNADKVNRYIFATITRTGGTYLAWRQKIESINVRDLVGKKCSLRVRLYHDVAGGLTTTLALWRPTDGLDTWTGSWATVASKNQVVANGVWTEIKIEGFTMPNEVANGALVDISFSVGALSNKFFAITEVQLEEGEVCTPFERRPVGVELALCQRYYAKTYLQPHAPGTATSDGALMINGSGGYFSSVNWRFPVEMRTVPTVAAYSTNTGASGMSRNASTGADITANIGAATGSAGMTSYYENIAAGHLIYGHFTAVAEL